MTEQNRKLNESLLREQLAARAVNQARSRQLAHAPGATSTTAPKVHGITATVINPFASVYVQPCGVCVERVAIADVRVNEDLLQVQAAQPAVHFYAAQGQWCVRAHGTDRQPEQPAGFHPRRFNTEHVPAS